MPSQLVDCIADLLRYEPKARLTTQECLDHPYFREVAYRFAPYDGRPPAVQTNGRAYSTQSLQSLQSLASPASQSPRVLPPSHANGTPTFHKPAFQVSGDRSRPPLPPAVGSPYSNGYSHGYQPPTSEDSAMEYQENQARQQPSPSTSSIWSGNLVESQWGRTPADQRSIDQRGIPAFGSHQARRGSFSESVAASTFYDGSIFEGIAPSRASSIMSFPIGYGNQEISNNNRGNYAEDLTLQFERNGIQSNSPPRNNNQLPSFAQQQQQAPVAQIPIASGSKSRSWGFSSVFNGATQQQPSSNPLKRSESIASVSGDGKSIILDPKKAKKEAERVAKEAEKVKRDALQMASRERARAVMRKKNQLMEAADPLNNYSNQLRLPQPDKGKARASISTTSLATSTSHSSRMPQIIEDTSRMHVSEMRHKTRRRDDDDDVHSVSSGDTGHSSQRASRPFSISSQATSASEPERSSGTTRGNRGVNGLARVTSLSSITSAQSSSRHHYGPAAPNTGHSSLDHAFIDEMRQLQTSGEPSWNTPVKNLNLETPRNHLRSPSPRDPSFDTRFSPYPASRVGHNLPAIDFNGNLKRSNLHTSASIASYHSTPGTLPSHFDLPFLPSMALDQEPNPSSTFPYSNLNNSKPN